MLKYFVILAVLLSVCFCGCGDNLNPIVSEDSTQVKIEIQKLVAGKETSFVEIEGERYKAWFVVSVTNLGDKEVIIDKSSFTMDDIKGSVIYSKEEVFIFDPTSAESIVGTALEYFLDMDNETTFVIKPKTTESVGLFTIVSTEPTGEWNLVYGNRQVVIPVQKMIEQAYADGKKTGEKPTSGVKDNAGNQPVDKPNDEKDSVDNQSNPSKEITSSDGASMALIPAGEFRMGYDGIGGDYDGDEVPAHTVYIDAFYMDKYEVTNVQYRKFVQATGHREPWVWEIDDDNDQPVVWVSWEDVNAYAEWAGKRLPTEAEWEKAARGGLIGKRYPWGDDIDRIHANWCGTKLDGMYGNDFCEFLGPVGSFKPNGYGLYDMSGNAWEWCADWYAADYYAESPYRNPQGPASGNERVTHGGGYDVSYVSVADRFPIDPHKGFSTVGFRCVMDAK